MTSFSLSVDGGKKLVSVGQHFSKENRLEFYNDTKNTLWKGKQRCLTYCSDGQETAQS